MELKFKTADLCKWFGLPTPEDVQEDSWGYDADVPAGDALVREAESHGIDPTPENLDAFAQAWRDYQSMVVQDASVKVVLEALEAMLDTFSDQSYEFFSEGEFKNYSGVAKGVTGYKVGFDETEVYCDPDIAMLIADCISGYGMFDVMPTEDPEDPQATFHNLHWWWEIYGEKKPEPDWDSVNNAGDWRGFNDYLKEQGLIQAKPAKKKARR